MKRLVMVVEGICDICGQVVTPSAEAGEHVFTFEGAPYIIDLCPEHSAQFSAALLPFTAKAKHSTPTDAKRPRLGRQRSGAAGKMSARQWARVNGFEVAGTGRLSPEVEAGYLEAQRRSVDRANPVPAAATGAEARQGLAEEPEGLAVTVPPLWHTLP